MVDLGPRPKSSALGPRRRGLSDTQFALALIAPAVAVVVCVLLFPLAFSFWASLNKVRGSNLSMSFTGLGNYAKAISNDLFAVSLTNTVYFAVVTVCGTVVIGLGMAVILNERFMGRGALRAIVILPWAVSQVVVGVIWGWIYNGSFGFLNSLLKGFGVIDSYKGWLSDPGLAMNLVAIAFVWSSVPFAVIVFLAALQSIPSDLYRAAAVDGANSWKRFVYITLPQLRYALLIVLVVATLDGLLAFTLIYVLTGGGPGTSTTVLSWLGYQVTFSQLDFGQGAAIFYMLVFVLMGAAVVYIKFLHRAGGEL